MRAPGGCRVWRSHKDLDQQAYLRWNGRVQLASRLAWENAHGPIPAGLVLRHKCRHKGCVEVRHMFIGRKRGEGHPLVKLTEKQILSIRGVPGADRSKSNGELARQYGVSARTISDVRLGRTWRHI